MFLLHERTRKSLCRTGFVSLCLLPTCAVVLWAAFRNGDGHRIRCEAELSRVLGLKVTVGNVKHPEPGVARYADLVLSDPETDEDVASAPIVSTQTKDGVLQVSAARLNVHAPGGGSVAHALHHWLDQRSVDKVTPLRLTIHELVIADAAEDVSLLGVAARLERTSEGRAAQLAFQTAHAGKDQTQCLLTIVRGHDAVVRFRFDTHGAFDPPDNHSVVVTRFLRALVTGNHAVEPVLDEAKSLLQVAR
jgi:hypothetical protein